METFRQILDLDEEDDHDFSLSMVEAYFEQAEDTFRKLDKNLCVSFSTIVSLLDLTLPIPFSYV
jgi:hypothetical protein